MQDYGVIRLLARASGGVGIICDRTDPLATRLFCEDRQFWVNSGPRISLPHLADKSRVVGEYGGTIEPISNRPFEIMIRSPNQVDTNGQAKKYRFICIQVRQDTAIRDAARQAAWKFQLSQDHLEAHRFVGVVVEKRQLPRRTNCKR